MRLRPFLLLLITPFVVCGCLTAGLDEMEIGRTHAYAELGDAYLDSAGNFYIRAKIERKHSETEKGESLGTRYIVANAPKLRATIEKEIAEAPESERDAMPYVYLSLELVAAQSAESAGALEEWFIFPADLTNEIRAPELPIHLQGGTWRKCAKEDDRKYLIPAYGGVPAAKLVPYVDSDLPDGTHRAWWSYPADLLYVPTVVLDIVLMPISVLTYPWWAPKC